MFNQRLISLALLASVATLSHAQWTDVRSLGHGGESTIVSDGRGNVYVTAHEPSVLYASRDWGNTFVKAKEFDDAFCDLHAYAWPDGRLNVAFIRNGISGLGTWYSADGAKSLKKGKAVDGPLDREWLAVNPKTGALFMNYSHGYIGGPKSTGIFLCGSTDKGATYQPISRVDKEEEGTYPVDPYLANSSDGKLYAMWQTSKDFNTIDEFHFAYSGDGGKTWSGHKTVAEFPRLDALDAARNTELFQERWILGAITAIGERNVVIVYPRYEYQQINGKRRLTFVEYYSSSSDAGKTFTAPRSVLSREEIASAAKSFYSNMSNETDAGWYIQTLPWLASDSRGRVHMAFQDNRTGQGSVNGKQYDKWHVRYVAMDSLAKGFGTSERVSKDVICKRPPLDFLSITADTKRTYISWTETPNAVDEWEFSGDLLVARKPNAKL